MTTKAYIIIIALLLLLGMSVGYGLKSCPTCPECPKPDPEEKTSLLITIERMKADSAKAADVTAAAIRDKEQLLRLIPVNNKRFKDAYDHSRHLAADSIMRGLGAASPEIKRR